MMRLDRAFAFCLVSALGALVASAAAETAPPAKRTPAPVLTSPASKAEVAHTPSQSEGAPSATTATYGDWVVRCAQQIETRTCEAVQTIYVQGQQNPIALIAIGRDKEKGPMRLVLQVGLNVTVSTRASIALKQDEPVIELGFERCVPSSCFAWLEPADEAVKRLRGDSDPGHITYKDASNRDVGIQFSLRGLGLALDALAKS
jgi:invasion protein IalB